MIKKLRIKFVVINMSIVTIMLCTIFGLVYYFTQADMEAQSIRMMKNIASHPFQSYLPSEPGEDVRLPYFSFQLDSKNKRMNTGGSYYNLSNEDFLDDLTGDIVDSNQRTGVLKKYNLRYCLVDNVHSRFLVFADISSEIAALDSLMKTSLIIGGVAFFAFLGISILLSGWVVRPVDQAMRQQKQFIADASHELKTPLTVIMANAQILSDHQEEKKNLKYILNLQTMAEQMKGLIEEMLDLAQTEDYDSQRVTADIDLSRLVENDLLPFEPIFFEQELKLETEIEPGIHMKGDAAQIRRLLEILVDNAQKYSRCCGMTRVVLKKNGKYHCQLMVENEGEPLSKEQLEHMFKRFYRGDEARNTPGSYGLGLSIARNIVKRHKGKIWAESSGGFNRCCVELHINR